MYRKIRNNIRQNDSNNQMNIINTLRKLWEQHIMWTRSFIISTAMNLPDLDLVTKRLLRNPTDFANVLRVYYGNVKAGEFEELLRQHLLIGAALVNAAKAGDTAAATETRKKWYANADEIATFLASINPNWDKQEWQRLLYDHLRMTEDEATYRLKGQYSQDIMIFDLIEDEALRMADYMAQGIIKQFNIQ